MKSYVRSKEPNKINNFKRGSGAEVDPQASAGARENCAEGSFEHFGVGSASWRLADMQTAWAERRNTKVQRRENQRRKRDTSPEEREDGKNAKRIKESEGLGSGYVREPSPREERLNMAFFPVGPTSTHI